MPEDFVSHDQQEMILRQVQRQELSASIKNAERQPRPAALRPDLERKPPIFCRRQQVLQRQKILGTRRRRHV
jgi:hypothetical protein